LYAVRNNIVQISVPTVISATATDGPPSILPERL